MCVIYLRIMTISGRLIAIVLLCSTTLYAQHVDPIDYVNVMTGTQSKYSFSSGNNLSGNHFALRDELLGSSNRRDGQRLGFTLMMLRRSWV